MKVAIHALKEAAGLASSALVCDAIVARATVLGLEPCWNAEGHLSVRAAAHADHRTAATLATAAAVTSASVAQAARKAASAAAKARSHCSPGLHQQAAQPVAASPSLAPPQHARQHHASDLFCSTWW